MRICRIGTGIVFLLFIFWQSGFCQDRQYRYGLSLYPHMSDGFAETSDSNAFYYRGSKTMSFTYSAGCTFEFETKSYWGAAIGLNFQRTGDKSILIPWDPHRGFPPRLYNHWHDYIELQLNVFRTFKDNWIIEMGISPLLNLSNEVRFLLDGLGDPYTMEIGPYVNSKFGITGNLGFGYILNGNNFLIKFTPYAQFNFIQAMSSYDFNFSGVVMDYLPARKYLNSGIRLSAVIKHRSDQ